MKRRKGRKFVTDYRGRIYHAITLSLSGQNSRETMHGGETLLLLLTRPDRQALHEAILMAANLEGNAYVIGRPFAAPTDKGN